MKDFFHNNLVRTRVNAGLTQEQLAEHLGVSRSVIVSLEGGRTNLFNKNISGIARILGTTEEELLCGVSADTLLHDEMTRSEREKAIIADYERRISELQAENDKLRNENETIRNEKEIYKELSETLNRHNQFLEDLYGKKT